MTNFLDIYNNSYWHIIHFKIGDEDRPLIVSGPRDVIEPMWHATLDAILQFDNLSGISLHDDKGEVVQAYVHEGQQSAFIQKDNMQ